MVERSYQTILEYVIETEGFTLGSVRLYNRAQFSGEIPLLLRNPFVIQERNEFKEHLLLAKRDVLMLIQLTKPHLLLIIESAQTDSVFLIEHGLIEL